MLMKVMGSLVRKSEAASLEIPVVVRDGRQQESVI